MTLDSLRRDIDRIDRELLHLLNQRMEFSLRTKGFKSSIEEPSREQEVLGRIARLAPQLISPAFSEKLFLQIIGESKRLQEQDLALVGFQGEHGAFSEMALKAHAPRAVTIPHPDFASVFRAVQDGTVAEGIVPVENSIAGNVTEVDDLLVRSGVYVTGEIKLTVRHCLLTLPGTDYRDVRIVYSHPQALAQCRSFLERGKFDIRPYFNTAGAARMLATERPAATAVIASRLSAEIYELEVLKEGIEDSTKNVTRFLLLGKEPSRKEGTKCSVVFVTKHKPGALLQILRVFFHNGTNLTRIESRPVPGDPGSFAFLLDFMGSDKEPAVVKALDGLREHASEVRLLGCYRELVEAP